MYRILNSLTQNTHLNCNINIIAYSIKNAEFPYLQFMLEKNEHECMILPQVICFDNMTEIDDHVNTILNMVLNIDANVEYKGCLEEHGNIYAFVDISDYDCNELFLARNSPFWFVLVDEIINSNSVCNFAIDPELVSVFSCNHDYILLRGDDFVYETPIVVYSGARFKKVEFQNIFNVSKDDANILGPYFYFTNYNGAVKMGWMDGKSGINRIAIFCGEMKIIFNTIDKIECFSDADKYEYNSAYINRLADNKNNVISDTPLWITKNLNQQISISHHSLDKRTMIEWNIQNKSYYIF
jgi:hypothetical protein